MTARRSRAARLALLAVGVGLLPLGIVAVRTLTSLAAEGAGVSLTIFDLAGALLAGDLARYGAYWGHTWLPVVFGMLAALGAWRLARHASRWANYFLLQALLPVALYYLVLRPVFAIDMPLYQSRQFIPLLPAVYVLVAMGLDALWAPLARHRPAAEAGAPPRGLAPFAAWLPAGAAVALCGVGLAASLVGVGRYWAVSKSPEGDAARFVRAQAAPGETVVSLHFSLDAALSAYTPTGPIYTKPLGAPPGTVFSTSLSVSRADWLTVTRNHSLAEITQTPQRWLLWLAGERAELVAALTQGCHVATEASYGPFSLARLTDCPTTSATPTAP